MCDVSVRCTELTWNLEAVQCQRLDVGVDAVVEMAGYTAGCNAIGRQNAATWSRPRCNLDSRAVAKIDGTRYLRPCWRKGIVSASEAKVLRTREVFGTWVPQVIPCHFLSATPQHHAE